MKKFLLLPFVITLTAMLWSGACLAQTRNSPMYMQVFFDGPNWLAGRDVVHYVPAFKGKAGELVAEGDDTRQLSPSRFLQGVPQTTTQSSSTTTVITEKGTFITGTDGKTHRQTDEDIRKANQAQQNSLEQSLQLLEKRSSLAREALTKALNDIAADGWEVVQMTSTGASGGLVYLLRKR